jgi:hypothetical protein
MRHVPVNNRSSRQGFFVFELLILLFPLALLMLGILLPALGRARQSARQIKDATQTRGVHQGMVLWAQNNNDNYPIPADADKENHTVNLGNADPAGKNTTANIFSMLLYHGFFSPELCVSPAEANPRIRLDDDFSLAAPKIAGKDPAKALWDPAFSADFTSKQGGNVSYAHTPPADKRLAQWALTFSETEPVIGNRGPQIKKVDGPVAVPVNKQSYTYLIHGGRTTWEGNIAYNDNHVDFETTMFPNTIQIKDRPWQDCLFFDEPEDKEGTNAFLGIITKGAATLREVTFIWD